MKKRKDIVYGALAFVGCLVIGYGGTRLLKSDNPEIVPQDTIVVSPEGNEDIDTPKDSISSDTIKNESKSSNFEDIQEKPSRLGETGNKTKIKKEIGTSEPKPALMSKEELESLIRNSSDNSLEGAGNEKTAKFVRITVTGMQPDEPNRPTRVAGVREKLETNTWKSVRVVSVESDPETGKITSAVVEPIY